jgi:hypothetical protein
MAKYVTIYVTHHYAVDVDLDEFKEYNKSASHKWSIEEQAWEQSFDCSPYHTEYEKGETFVWPEEVATVKPRKGIGSY